MPKCSVQKLNGEEVFFKEKAKRKINYFFFLDRVYLYWTCLDISAVGPVYISHEVPKTFWQNPE